MSGKLLIGGTRMKKINYGKIFLRLAIIFVVLFLIMIMIYQISKKIKKDNLNSYDWMYDHITFVQNENFGSDIYEVIMPEDVSMYNLKYQEALDDKIFDLHQNHRYDQPVLMYNPYGTNLLSLNLYFESDEKILVSYQIDTDGFPSFQRDLDYQEEQAYQLIGFLPGYVNTLTLTFKNEQGQQIYQKQIEVDFRNVKASVDTTIETENGDSTEALTDGLYAVLGHDKTYNSNIYFYDNDGVLRGEIPLKGYRTDRIEFVGDCMVYTYDQSHFAFVNSYGKIEKTYNIGNYTFHHDYRYDEENNRLLILAQEKGADTIEDRVISLDLSTGEVKELLNMEDYLGEFKEKSFRPEKNTYGGTELDWVHLNSIDFYEDSLFLSSRELSSIIKISSFDTDPKIDYIIADPSMYENSSYQNLLLSKVGDFTSNAGQHSVNFIDLDVQNGKYYLTLYNNNYGGSATMPEFTFDNYPGVGSYEEGEHSMYYKYLIDEKAKTYTLVQEIDVPYSSIVSNVEDYKGNIISSSGKSHLFEEYDKNGKLIRRFRYPSKKFAYRVIKYDL